MEFMSSLSREAGGRAEIREARGPVEPVAVGLAVGKQRLVNKFFRF